MDEPISCPVCRAEQPVLLGSLGNRLHLRCRECGWDWSTQYQPPEPDPEAADDVWRVA